MGEMLGTISISSLTTMTCLSLVALALGAASTASGGRVVSVDYCLGNQIPPAQKHSVSQSLRHTSLPAHIRAFSGATSDTVGVDDGCEHLVRAGPCLLTPPTTLSTPVLAAFRTCPESMYPTPQLPLLALLHSLTAW
jgi:hypothetical protein